MKKISALIFITALTVFLFFGCSEKNKFDIGEESTVTVIQNGEKEEQAHITDEGYVDKMDHLGTDGNVLYTENYVYDSDGSVTAYIYRDKDDNFIAKYDLQKSKFYNERGKEISENDFMAKIRALEEKS